MKRILLLVFVCVCSSAYLFGQDYLRIEAPCHVNIRAALSGGNYLYEDRQSTYNFLGNVNTVANPTAETTLYLDTAYVNRGAGVMPQYLLVAGHEKTGEGYVRGRFLLNATALAATNPDFLSGIWERLAFVEAVHANDALYILGSETVSDLSTLDELEQAGTIQKVNLDDNSYKDYVFSFRLVEEGSADVFIESEENGYVGIRNGVPVIVRTLDLMEAELFVLETTPDDDNPPVADELTVSESTLTFTASGGSQPIAVTANVNWTAVSSDAWATVSPASGSDNGTVSITAAANTGDARTATITLTGSNITCTVTVTQAGRDYLRGTEEPCHVKIRSTLSSGNYLFEDRQSTYSGQNINLLGYVNTVANPTTETTLYLDTAYVFRGGRVMPQYMIVAGHEKTSEGYIRGRFLLNATALAATNPNYLWNGRERLAFVEAVHANDALYILGSETVSDLSTLDGLAQAGTIQKVNLGDNSYKHCVFSFRLVEEGSADVLIESEADGYVGIHSGVPVIVRTLDLWEAELFVLETTPDDDDPAVADVLTVSEPTLTFTASGGSLSIAVTANVNWTAVSSDAWVTVSPASGSNNGTVSVTAAANTGDTRTATITLTGSDITRTVAVTQVADQQVVVEPSQPEGDRGVIDVALNIPVDEPFTVAFTVTLPAGFLLDTEATELESGLQSDFLRAITPLASGGWLFYIYPKVLTRAAGETAYRQIVRIAYTMDASVTKGDYEATFSNVILTLNSGEEIYQDEIKVPVTVTSSVGNAWVSASDIRYADGILSVRTPAAERIDVYAVSGSLLYQVQKASGEATFNLNRLPQGILIIKGSSGWTRKIVK
ncbi:MAG: BACON domain-containing protein [Tannerella sp.]|jgi:hypothetical protein|nr:BACON domain-containing protein [Tannerella sp.]